MFGKGFTCGLQDHGCLRLGKQRDVAPDNRQIKGPAYTNMKSWAKDEREN